MYHRRVNKTTGKNPVARAVARKQLESVILSRKIQLYMTKDGERCADLCGSIGFTLSVLVYAAELDKAIGTDNPEVRKMRGAISACAQMCDTDSYVTLNTVSLDQGLQAAVELNKRLNPDAVNAAFNKLSVAGA